MRLHPERGDELPDWLGKPARHSDIDVESGAMRGVTWKSTRLNPASPSARPTRTSTAALSTTLVVRCHMMLSLPVAIATLMLASCPDAVRHLHLHRARH